MQPPIIVTRHAALVEYIRKHIDEYAEVIEHATPKDVADRDVIGVLPLYLASYAKTITTVDLDMPIELRGQELTTEQLEQYFVGFTTYTVSMLGGNPYVSLE